MTARVASCVPLGNDGTSFLIGAALYTHGNVWGIADPPEDWGAAMKDDPVPGPRREEGGPKVKVKKAAWPYNMFSDGAELHPGRK